MAALVCGLFPVLLGAVAFFQTPVARLPGTEMPALSVEVDYPGVGPEKIEEIITRPLEESISAASGIQRLYSTSRAGRAKVNVEFRASIDPDFAALDVRERIDPVIATFPREVQPPVVIRFDPARRPVMIVTLESRAPLHRQREYAERVVRKSLESVPGIGEVLVAGGRQREVLVEVDRAAIETHGLALGEILQKLGEFNASRFAGELARGSGSIDLHTKGRLRNLADIRAVPLHARPGRPGERLRIGDIARVKHGFRDANSASRLNGEDRVSLYLFRAGKAGLPDISREVRARLQGMEPGADGAGTRFAVRFDSARDIQTAFRFMALSLTGSVLLLCLVLFYLFEFRVREILLLLLTLPAVGLMASLGLFITGGQYDLITVPGFILGAGMALVFSVETLRTLRDEKGPAAADRLAGPMSTVVVAILAGFIPILFAAADLRTIYSGIGIVLIFSIVGAMLWCLIVLPVLQRNTEEPTTVSRRIPAVLQRARNFVFERGPRSLFAVARRDLSPVAVFGVYGLVLVAGLLALRASRFEYAGTLDPKRINGQLEFPSGTAFTAANAGSRKVEDLLRRVPGVTEITARVEEARSTLRLKLDRPANQEFIAELKKAAGNTAPAFLFFEDEGSGGGPADFRIDVFGDDPVLLNEITQDLARRAEGVEDVAQVVLRYKSPRPELRLHVDRVRAEVTAVGVRRIGESVRLAIQGGIATRLLERDREIDVRVRLGDEWRRSLEGLQDYRIKATASGDPRMVPLSGLVRTREGEVPPKIYRRDKKRSLSFSVSGDPGSAPDALIARLETELRKRELPEGYRFEFGDEVEEYRRNRRRLIFIFLLGFLLVYMSLAGLAESFSVPFRRLVHAPFPIAAATLVLYVFGIPLSVPILIAFFLISALILFQVQRLESGAPGESGESGRFAGLVLLLAAFYGPLALLFVPGGEVLRGTALALLIGAVSGAVVTPFMREHLRTR